MLRLTVILMAAMSQPLLAQSLSVEDMTNLSSGVIDYSVITGNDLLELEIFQKDGAEVTISDFESLIEDGATIYSIPQSFLIVRDGEQPVVVMPGPGGNGVVAAWYCYIIPVCALHSIVPN